MKKVLTFLLLLAGLGLGANNLQIKNVVLVDNDSIAKTVMIRFDISWDHSWRDAINWDAAWVFAKYYDGTKPYKHCKLSLGGETPGTGTAHALIVPNDSLELDGTYYGVGAFIHRSELSDGTFHADSAMLKWNYGLNGFDVLPDDIELHVYGTEMVYIPEGPFAFGDGDGENMSDDSWHLKDSPDYVCIGNYSSAKMVYSGSINPIQVHGINGLDWDSDSIIDNPNFPTGYNAFYMMKYEITQGQYADFLNSLTNNQILSSNLFPDYSSQRFVIFSDSGYYICSRPNRACNYLMDERVLSLADWMGLRPMTEMEFEKAARGSLTPIQGDFAWGDDYNSAITLSSIQGDENGTETPIPTLANFHNSEYGDILEGGDGGKGPIRSGLFASENSNRTQSGASYYGVMELSGNLGECMVLISSIENQWGFQSVSGDGEITNEGRSNSFLLLNEGGGLMNYYDHIQSIRYFSISKRAYSNVHYSGTRFVRNQLNLP